MYKQYKLKSGELERICWLDSVNLMVGQQLSLKKDIFPDRIWAVSEVYDKIEEHPPWRTWKVGGLQ